MTPNIGHLTVIMPCFNERATIDEIVRRVLDSPHTGELLIVDDGSTDGTREILARVDDERVRVILQPENRGKGAAVRIGFTEATCEFVIVQDADLEYIYYGVREFAMAACMNGLALHGGFIPYGGTFLIFTDYARPAIRLAALMGLRSIFVMTHDSIGLGEDGPTHQTIEHLMSLRAIPGLNVFRPSCAVEVAECWALALEDAKKPSIIALTRQTIAPVRNKHYEENMSARGPRRRRRLPRGREARRAFRATYRPLRVIVDLGEIKRTPG